MSDVCRECRTPLAPDQRYCLACGARQGERPTLPPTATPAVAAAVPEPVRDWRSRANAAAVAGVATLLLSMGVGVLIGRAGRPGTPERAAAPQVIRVSGGAAAAPTAAGSAEADTSTPTSRHRKRSTRRSVAHTKAKTKATNPALSKLDKLSPKEYQKRSEKLPKTVGTGGKAPPKDHKKAAGGGGFEAIG